MSTKINFDAFEALFVKFKVLTDKYGSLHPRPLEDWVKDWLDWLLYPTSAIKSLDKVSVSAKLAETYPGIIRENFDSDEYYDNLEEETALMRKCDVSDLKRERLTLVKK